MQKYELEALFDRELTNGEYNRIMFVCRNHPFISKDVERLFAVYNVFGIEKFKDLYKFTAHYKSLVDEKSIIHEKMLAYNRMMELIEEEINHMNIEAGYFLESEV